jgi:hypothetical protein
MSEIPEKKENFETSYSDYIPIGNSIMFGSESNDTISFVGSNLPGGMGDDHIRINNYWGDGGFSITGNPYASPDVFNFGAPAAAVTFANNHSTTMSSQSVSLNPVTSQKLTQEHFWKFGEGETLKAVNDYIVSTYRSHYASEKSKVQVLDMIDAIGDGVPFCRDNLIKYSSRFGKKDGMSRLDALKIIHYGILLYHFAGFNNETKNNNETF